MVVTLCFEILVRGVNLSYFNSTVERGQIPVWRSVEYIIRSPSVLNLQEEGRQGSEHLACVY